MVDRQYVFDTNVIVSALLLHASTARQAFDKAMSEGKLLLSFPTIMELYDVLRRPAFNRYLTEDERLQFLTAFISESKLVEISQKVAACRDPKDDKFLELAVNGRADCIVSGDEDLLVLHPFRGIEILSPRAFLEDR